MDEASRTAFGSALGKDDGERESVGDGMGEWILRGGIFGDETGDEDFYEDGVFFFSLCGLGFCVGFLHCEI